jgi:hypothetical protein
MKNIEEFDAKLCAIVSDRRCHRIVTEAVTRMLKIGILTAKHRTLQNVHPTIRKIDDLVDEFTDLDLERRVVYARVILVMAQLDFDAALANLAKGVVTA